MLPFLIHLSMRQCRLAEYRGRIVRRNTGSLPRGSVWVAAVDRAMRELIEIAGLRIERLETGHMPL